MEASSVPCHQPPPHGNLPWGPALQTRPPPSTEGALPLRGKALPVTQGQEQTHSARSDDGYVVLPSTKHRERPAGLAAGTSLTLSHL